MSTMIRKLIRERQQELIDLAASFIRIPNENPSPQFAITSAQMGDLVHQYLKSKGLLTKKHQRKNSALITVVGDAPLNGLPGPRLLFSGHSDVVPAGDPTKWSFEPFSGEVIDRMLLGRGASDMKGGLASLLFVAGLLQELAPSLNLKGSLGVIATPDEESGGVELASLLDQGLMKGDACLIGEPTYPHHPIVGEKGWLLMWVITTGKTGHGSLQPLAGISAIRRAAVAVEKLAKIWEMKVKPPEDLRQLLRNTEWFLTNRQGKPALTQLLYRPSYNPGIIQGGIAVNSVADKCLIEVDIRVPYGMETEYVLEVARNLVEEAAPGSVVEPIVPYNNPNWTLQSRPIVQATGFGIQSVLGTKEPIFSVLLLNSSNARHYRRHGIDTVLYGPGLLPTIHGYNEKVSVESLVKSAEIYAETAIKYLT